MGNIFKYCDMSLTDLGSLNGDRSVFLMSVSPIEVHGPHLPVGTDVFISEMLQQRYIKMLSDTHPELDLVVLPPLFAGSTPLPVKGSIAVPAKALESLLFAFAADLAKQGFKYLLISDNHGGPGHQLAIEAAARKAYKKFKFHLLDPFNYDYRKMVECDPVFLSGTGLGKGSCGDDTDCHAGTNETSLMMVTDPGMIKRSYKELPASVPPEKRGIARAIMSISRIAGAIGAKRFSGDLAHLSNVLAWIGQPNMVPYMGDPKLASEKAGEAMMEARVKAAGELFEKALRGENVRIDPLLWQLRLLKGFL